MLETLRVRKSWNFGTCAQITYGFAICAPISSSTAIGNRLTAYDSNTTFPSRIGQLDNPLFETFFEDLPILFQAPSTSTSDEDAQTNVMVRNELQNSSYKSLVYHEDSAYPLSTTFFSESVIVPSTFLTQIHLWKLEEVWIFRFINKFRGSATSY